MEMQKLINSFRFFLFEMHLNIYKGPYNYQRSDWNILAHIFPTPDLA